MLVAMALCVKALIPAGYMVEATAKSFTVLVCQDSLGAHSAKQITVPQAGGKADAAAKANQSCPYSVLGTGSTGAADPIQLGLALAFILAIGFIATPQLRLARVRHVTPPQCGPPTGLLTA